ncbi:MAG TPA: hypothetical protein VE631_03030 [Alphaproteobacteria bacterium]|nr:hypothetical protein [Alphaproteobacteria bacterium]
MFARWLLAAGLAAGLGLGLAAPAFAYHCPKDMAKIDAALKTASLSQAERGRVIELRRKGEEEHKAGNHDAAVKSLGEAMTLLGIE